MFKKKKYSDDTNFFTNERIELIEVNFVFLNIIKHY